MDDEKTGYPETDNENIFSNYINPLSSTEIESEAFQSNATFGVLGEHQYEDIENENVDEKEEEEGLDISVSSEQNDYNMQESFVNEVDLTEYPDKEYRKDEIFSYSPFNDEIYETSTETLDQQTAEVIEWEAAKVTSSPIVKTCEGLYCWVKSVLNKQLNLNLPSTNNLDEPTKKAIGEFQLKNNLAQTKKIDPATERALLECDAIQKHKGTAGESAAVNIISSARTKIEDWTKQAIVDKPEITNFYRDPRKLWAFVLHHMAFKRKNRAGQLSDPNSYLKTGGHFCIMMDGRIIQLHQFSRMIWHAQCISPRSVAVEFEGNFPNIKGKWWIDKDSTVQNKDVPTQSQYDSGRFLASYLKIILGTTHILAHRQSSDSRENDPGPDIWYNVGQWAMDNLKLTDGGTTFKCGSGNPILPEWRNWGDKTIKTINKEYDDMEEEVNWENTDTETEPVNFEPVEGEYETGTGESEVENLYNDETGEEKDFKNEYENFDEGQGEVVMNPPDMFSNNIQNPAQPVILARAESTIPFSNEMLTFYKMYDKVNKKFIGECYDEQGNKITLSDIRNKENELPENVNNKIHPSLQKQILKVADSIPVDIAVWLNIEVKEPLKTNFRPENLVTMPNEIADYRRKLAVTIGDTVRKVTIERSGIQVQRVSDLLPLFFAKATKRTIDLIKNDPLVLGIFYNDRSYFESLNTSLSRSGAAEAQTAGMTNLGKDIKVAVWENAPDLLTNLTIEGYYDTATPNVSNHSRLVSAIIKNKEPGKPKGYAPNCKLYSANLSGSDVFAPLEWAVKQGCTVINRSFHQDTDQVNAGLQLSDFITDALALRYPYPMIVQASGNTGQPDDTALGITPPGNEYVNHKGYNSIAVGSHDEQTERKISSFSTFRNPSSPHNDRELPEICALGENISAVGLTDWGGTSFASPAVAGSAALLQSLSPVIKLFPEVTRALLLAGSKRNVEGGLWYEDLKRTPKVDQKDGTGALNIYESITIAKKPYQPKKVALDKGWDYGMLDASSFGPDKISLREWKITVPQSRKHVKIVLAWNGNANYQEIWLFRFLKDTTLDMDLDIVVYDDKNKLIATSSSYDNSFEIADYIAKGGQTLTVKVRGYSIKPNVWTYFGLAWTTF